MSRRRISQARNGCETFNRDAWTYIDSRGHDNLCDRFAIALFEYRNAFTISSISISRRFKRTGEFVDGKKASRSRQPVHWTMLENEGIVSEAHRLYICVYIYLDRGNAIHRGGFVRNRGKFAEIRGLREIKVSTCRSFYCTIDRRWQFREKEEKKGKNRSLTLSLENSQSRCFWWRNRWKQRERERGRE